jgi:hypothetical protein
VKPLGPQQHGDLTSQAIEAFLEGLDCPRSLAVYLLYTNNEHEQLVSLEFNPFHYNDLDSARTALASTKLLSKATFLNTSIDLRSKALETFQECETITKATNRRIITGRFFNSVTHSVLLTARTVIARILGDFVPETFVDACNWGPGASTSIKRRDATAPTKYEIESHITPSALTFVKDWFNIAYPLWNCNFEVQSFSKVVTVPKNSKTDRTIAIEPGINLWFQKGIGSMIRSRLQKEGIDLDDQTHNQKKARTASKFNDLATVDFSSASDTVSKSIVRELIPGDWLTVLETFRSSAYMLDGNTAEFNKFSSMGNGFTFELESLIFYALAVGVNQQLGLDKRTISVYGDDVILPSRSFDLYRSVCEDVGFRINVNKSYSDSYYRESCGSHFWNGIDIKPIFLKEKLIGRSEVLKFANNVRRLAHRYSHNSCDARFRRCWSLLRGSLGRNVPLISEGYGDLGLVVNLDEVQVPKRAANGIEGFLVPVYGLVPRTLHMEGNGVLLAKLRKLGFGGIGNKAIADLSEGREEGNNIPLPCRTKVAKFRILVRRWIDLGPWI